MAARRTQEKPKTRSDAYVGLLFISLLAQIAGAVFFYLDYSQYPTIKPATPPAISAPAAPQGQPGGAVIPGGGQPKDGGAPKDGGGVIK